MTLKTPQEIAEEAITADAGVPDRLDEIYSNTYEGVRDLIVKAIEADRVQRSKMEKFGAAIYELMDGEEWSSDTLQAIGDYAALTLDMPFSEPAEDHDS